MRFQNNSMNFKYYKVGGCVRDFVMGIKPKDIDLLAVGGSFEELESDITSKGGEIYVSKPEYLTVRCKYPGIGPCDVRLARTDGEYKDGRRPSQVFVAQSVEDDIRTRDFTINALLQDIETEKIIDFVGGVEDIQRRVITCVGHPKDRFGEDYLRILRAIRFAVTKGFSIGGEIQMCLKDPAMVNGLDKISRERVREELFKMFEFSTSDSLAILDEFPLIKHKIFKNKNVFGIWLKPTLNSDCAHTGFK